MSPHSACLCFCLKERVATQLRVVLFILPATHPSIHPSIRPTPSIHPKAFQRVQPAGKQGNHVKWTLDSTNGCRRGSIAMAEQLKTIYKCALFPHEEIKLPFFICVPRRVLKAADENRIKSIFAATAPVWNATFIY